MKYLKFIAPSVLIALVKSQTSTTNQETQTQLDTDITSYIPFTLGEAINACYVEFKTGGDAGDLSSNTDIQNNVSEFLMCTTGARTDAAGNSYTEPNPVVQEYQSKHCKYLLEDVDGSDQLQFYYSAQRCYQNLAVGNNAYNYDSSGCSLPVDNALNLDHYYNVFINCIDKAVEYVAPYAERQFVVCRDKCDTDHRSDITGIQDGQTVKSQLDADAGFLACVNASEACAKFMILNEGDKTAAGYKTNFEACYTASDGGCDSAVTNTEFNNYNECVAKCEMPDYSYTVVAGSQVLRAAAGFMVLVLAVILM